MNQRKLYRMARSLFFRRRMAETMESMEDEIRSAMEKEAEDEMIIGDFKISVNKEGQIEIIEMPRLDLRQLTLPMAIEAREDKER